MSDSEILDLFFNRSERAITAVDDKYGKLCKKIALNIVGNEEDAKECVNDTFHGLWNVIPPTRPVSLKAYACQMARNLSLKRYHSNTAEKRNCFYDTAIDELCECLKGKEDVEDTVMAEELSVSIQRFLGELKANERIIFVRRYWYADSAKDIAQLMNMKENAVVVKLHRTRGKLKEYLKTEGYQV